MSLCEFGERVLFMPSRVGRGGDLEMKFFYGTFVGVHGPSDELVVATPEGALRTRTIRRLLIAEQWVRDDLLNMKCSPSAPIDGEKEEPIPAIIVTDTPKKPAVHTEVIVNRRRMKITKADLVVHGYTPGCHGCNQALRGGTAQTHSEACRRRMESAIGATPEGAARLVQAADRVNEAIAQQDAKRARAAPGADGGESATAADTRRDTSEATLQRTAIRTR